MAEKYNAKTKGGGGGSNWEINIFHWKRIDQTLVRGGGGQTANRPKGIDLFAENNGGIFKQSMGVRNRIGMGLSYRLHRLAESIPWNQSLVFFTD